MNETCENQLTILPKGTPLGLCDTHGVEFKVGSVVRGKCEFNFDVHGPWVDYEIKLQGIIPILSYLKSEKGQVLPEGHSASCLSDIYDLERFVFSKKLPELRPEEDWFIQN